MDAREREYLRELAKKQLEYAQSPLNKEREERWYRHNSLSGNAPMVVVEEATFFDDVAPPLRCQSEIGRDIEYQLLKNIFAFEKIGDDKVVPDFVVVYADIRINNYGINFAPRHTEGHIGYRPTTSSPIFQAAWKS